MEYILLLNEVTPKVFILDVHFAEFYQLLVKWRGSRIHRSSAVDLYLYLGTALYHNKL
ncbi:hypothetical protein GGR42_002419 [Saonia flava]|uniref:Uncharacterized protein n=1 Tax=Saonia flava TaxID=523696 RepID=A0A846QXP4_9FLAO|nr:hypothetical protein [Saonia flava]